MYWRKIYLWTALLSFFCYEHHQALAVTPGQIFPMASLPTFQGPTWTSKGLKDKISLINFWATWCEACKTELIEMEKEFRPFLHENGVQFVYINLDKEKEKAINWAKEHLTDSDGFLAHNLWDGSLVVADLVGVDSFPMTMIVNQVGKVIYIQKGFTPGEGSSAKIAANLRGLAHQATEARGGVSAPQSKKAQSKKEPKGG